MTDVFKTAIQFARTRLIFPVPESAHVIKVAIDEALKCKETGESKCIQFNLTGHGNFDLAVYEEYMAGKLSDYEDPDDQLNEGLKCLPQV